MCERFHETMLMNNQLCVRFCPTSFDPPVTHKSDDGQWRYHEIDDTTVQTLCRLMTQLLCSFGAN